MKESVEDILKQGKAVAVVGLSPKPERDSHQVAKYLQSQGYRVIPVNPMADQVLGQRCYPDLQSVS
ncbi:MAG: CoA-binding protein, partial [Dehalococcoidia bacterium]